ncbi:MAG: hypothetical protein K6T78_07725 [Alicyclobacillus sp.]|nr:hypothetical protein [Alicyclobacillus sp.]
MAKEPELPELMKDLEILQSLGRLKHPNEETLPIPEPSDTPTDQAPV